MQSPNPSVRRRRAAGGAAGAAGGSKGGAAGGAATGGAAGLKRGAASIPLASESRGKAPRVSAPAAGRAARAGAPPFCPPQLQGRCGCGARLLGQGAGGLARGACAGRGWCAALQYTLWEINFPLLLHWQREELPCMFERCSHMAYAGAVALLQPACGVHAAAVETVVEEGCCKSMGLLQVLQCGQAKLFALAITCKSTVVAAVCAQARAD